MNPHLHWLQRRFSLPELLFPSVSALMEAEGEGSTSLELTVEIAQLWERHLESFPETPLVLQRVEQKYFLQSLKLATEETTIRDAFQKVLKEPGEVPAGLAERFAAINPGGALGEFQIKAIENSFVWRFSVITGGAGTGKTFTMVRLILAHLMSIGAPEKILLAAPTGKAARRMAESIDQFLLEGPDLSPEVEECLSVGARETQTVHGLLGIRRKGGEPTRSLPGNALVILDETSMMDVHLWSQLLARVPDSTRLVFVGDPFQLESVEMGSVLLSLSQSPEMQPLITALQGSRRSRNQGLLALAEAVKLGQSRKAIDILENPPEGISWFPGGSGNFRVEDLPPFFRQTWLEGANEVDPVNAYRKFSGQAVLTAHRDMRGAGELNQKIGQWVYQQGGRVAKPILIVSNDRMTGLQNGELGVLIKGVAFFPDKGGDLRSWPVHELPAWLDAWAITIHRAQGSEYNHVLLFLPNVGSRLLARSLLYTGMTRARSYMGIYASSAAITRAVETVSQRACLAFSRS